MKVKKAEEDEVYGDEEENDKDNDYSHDNKR